MSNLILFEEKNVAKLFKTEKGIQPLLDKIEKEVMLFEPDMTSEKGRADIKSMAYKVAQTKTAIDKFGADLVADQKRAIKVVDVERKRSKDFLDALKKKVRKPLTDWEIKESERLARFSGIINTMKEFMTSNSDMDIDVLRHSLDSVNSVVIDESWSEFELAGRHAKEASINHLEKVIKTWEERKVEREEIELLRKKQEEIEKKRNEELIAKKAAEKATKEANEKAELKLKVEKEKAAKKLAVEKEKAAKAKIEADRALEYEKKKQALKEQQAAEMKALEEKRAADLEHTKNINNLVLDQMVVVSGINSAQAKKIVISIAKNEFKNLTIKY